MLGERLKQLREEAGYTQQQLARLVNLSQQTIGHYEVGRARPDADTLELLADIFGTTVDYILGRTDDRNTLGYSFLSEEYLLKNAAEGDSKSISTMLEMNADRIHDLVIYMAKAYNKESRLHDLLSQGEIGFKEATKNYYKHEDEDWEIYKKFGFSVYAQNRIVFALHKLLRPEPINYKSQAVTSYPLKLADSHANTLKNKYVPILGQIKMGLPLLAEENYAGELEIPSDINADFALECKGDSMIGVGLLDGDYALCRKQETAYNGDIVVALHDISAGYSEATLKFYFREDEGPLLRAANPDYADIPLNGEYRIAGVLVATLRKGVPSYSTYTNYIATKDSNKEMWDPVLEKAFQLGIKPYQMISLLEMMHQASRSL